MYFSAIVYWGILEYTGVYWSILGYTGSILEYTGVYWSVLGYTGVYWSLLEYTGGILEVYWECTGVYSTRLYWNILEYTVPGVDLFHNECSDAMLFGGHVSFSIDDENVGIWSVSDPELTAVENIVVA